MKIAIACTFILVALLYQFGITTAYPYSSSSSIDRFDDNVQDVVASDDYRNSRLRRAYYYDDYYDDYYPYRSYGTYGSNASPIRRADTDVDRAYKYTPLVRYKQTRTKRKKLFVPNLWG